MIIETLKLDLNSARKAKDSFKITTLSTVIGEMSANAVMKDGQKVVSDEAALKTIKKFIKGIDESLEIVSDKSNLLAEREILSAYMPQTLSTEELSSAIAKAISEGATNMGLVMGYLKSHYPNLYDGKQASQIANAKLKEGN